MKGEKMLSKDSCPTQDKAYIRCDKQTTKQHTKQQEVSELKKEYEKNGLTVKVYIPKLDKAQNEKRNTEIKERVIQIIQKCVS